MADFRRKKFEYIFNVFFDVNKSGSIDKKDFEIAVEKICKSRGWAADSQNRKKISEKLLQIWEGLRQKADSDNDGQVSLDEWISMWNEYAKNPENPLEWQNQYLKFMFELEDASGDGNIDINEFTNVYSCYGIEKSECKEAFQKMSSGKSEVTYETFANLWKQFFTSENPADPGNFIFGKTKF